MVLNLPLENLQYILQPVKLYYLSHLYGHLQILFDAWLSWMYESEWTDASEQSYLMMC